MLRLPTTFAFALAVGWPSSAALAQTSAPAGFSLSYDAPHGCPTSRRFSSEVLARTKRARAAFENERAYRFVVRIESGPGRYLGHLEIEDPDGATTQREMDDPDCANVVSALALIAALWLDPQASTTPIQPWALDTAEPLNPDKPKEPQSPAAPLLRSAEALPKRPKTADVVEISAGKRALPVELRNGAEVLAANAIFPEVLLGLALFVDLGAKKGGGLGWATRLSFLYSPEQSFRRGPSSARFRWLVARLEGCPIGWRPGRRF